MKRKIYIILFLGIIISLITVTVNTEDPGLNNEEVKTIYKNAREAFYQGELTKALKSYNIILESRPEEFAAIADSWFINKELGNLKQALKLNNKIIDLKTDSFYWKYQLGATLYQLNKYQQAREVLTDLYLKVKDSEGKNLTNKERSLLYYYLGKSYYKTGEVDKAEFFFARGLEKMPQLALNQLALGEIYQDKGENNKAFTAYREALKKDYSLSFLYPRLATLAEKNSEPEQAYYYWRRSLIKGEEVELARERLNNIKEKYPQFEEQYQSDREREYRQTKLVEVEPVKGKNIPLVRVGLVDKTRVVSFRTGAPFKLLNGNDEVIFSGNTDEEWTIIRQDGKFLLKNGLQPETGAGEIIREITDKGPLVLRLADRRHTFLIYNIAFGEGYFWAGEENRQYRGELELLPNGKDNFKLINLVNIEEYLFSVVPAEMPAWWPEEALKSQAIAARTYALSFRGRHDDDGYDLCSGVHCAVYKGAGNENGKSNQAVLETSGEAAVYQDRLISAVFTSNSGGYSESSADIWGYEHPYLQGANNLLGDDYQFPLEPYRLAEWLLKEPESYSSKAVYAGYNKYRWVKEINGSYFEKRYDLKGLKNIIPLVRTSGGTVGEVILQGTGKDGQPEEIKISKDLIRSRLGGLKSNRFIIDKIYDKDGNISKVIFYGSGFGHSVGMDQTGAAGMAKSGKDYQEIIGHFYQGAELKKIY